MSGSFDQLDPRSRIVTVVAATIIVASTPRGLLPPFVFYGALALALVQTSRSVSGYHLTARCLTVAPFVLLASGLLLIHTGLTPEGVNGALSVALKGFTAALLLAFLTATTPLPELLWALRKLKSPHSLNVILGMMHRYTGLLSEEYSRMERARESRTVRPLGSRRYSIYGRHLGTLVLRSWDRADRVHAAMLARGFSGTWPEMHPHRFGAADAAYPVVANLLFLASRLFA